MAQAENLQTDQRGQGADVGDGSEAQAQLLQTGQRGQGPDVGGRCVAQAENLQTDQRGQEIGVLANKTLLWFRILGSSEVRAHSLG